MFTSSSRIYCDGILRNVVESDGEKFFDFKLFKNHLVNANRKLLDNSLIKNLEILLSGRSLSDIVIVDNRSTNYCE
jgi:TFIIF-interacting CTD phosphatase-like protein